MISFLLFRYSSLDKTPSSYNLDKVRKESFKANSEFKPSNPEQYFSFAILSSAKYLPRAAFNSTFSDSVKFIKKKGTIKNAPAAASP